MLLVGVYVMDDVMDDVMDYVTDAFPFGNISVMSVIFRTYFRNNLVWKSYFFGFAFRIDFFTFAFKIDSFGFLLRIDYLDFT